MSLEQMAVRGVLQQYGPRNTDESYGGDVPTRGHIKMKEWSIDLANKISGAPSTSNEIAGGSTSDIEAVIPAYAKIVSVRVEVLEDITTTGGTVATTASLQFGLEQSDGTAIDVDGLIDATDGDLTIASNNISESRGSVLVGSNAALVPNVSIGADPGELVGSLEINDVTNMTAVAGKVRVLVEYIQEGAA